MRVLIAAGKHVNDIRAIARQPPIPTIERGGVFLSGPPRGYIARSPGRLNEFSSPLFAGEGRREHER
jgi:hypothetical protein